MLPFQQGVLGLELGVAGDVSLVSLSLALEVLELPIFSLAPRDSGCTGRWVEPTLARFLPQRDSMNGWMSSASATSWTCTPAV